MPPRIYSILGQTAFNAIVNNTVDANRALDYIFGLRDALKRNNAQVLLYLPNTILNSGMGSRTRILFESLRYDSQGPLQMFSPGGSACGQFFICNDQDLAINLPYLITFLYNQTNLQRIPIIFDLSKGTIVKSKCSACINSQEQCATDQINFPLLDSYTKQREVELHKELNAIEKSLYGYPKLTIGNFKALASKIFKEYGIALDTLHKCNSLEFIDSFIKDVNKEKDDVFKMIIASLARAICFPSTREQDHHVNSIDWHPESTQPNDAYECIRIDVVSPHKTGTIKSGTRRLAICICKKTKKKVALAYTNNHDFSDRLLKNRLGKVKQKYPTT